MKQLNINADKLAVIFQTILDLVETIEHAPSKEAMKQLFEDIGGRYFSAPASHRVTYHNCFPGGLAEHTLRVYGLLKDLCAKYSLNISHDSIVKVALLHDLGKVGDEKADYYLPQTSQWHKDKLGEYYTFNDDIVYMQHSHRSLYMCQVYRIPLTSDEFKAILIHDGQYIDANAAYKNNEGMFAILTHMADNIACNIEKEKYRKFIEK